MPAIRNAAAHGFTDYLPFVEPQPYPAHGCLMLASGTPEA